GQIAVAALEGDRELGAVEGEGEQETTIGLELGQPLRGNVPAGGGEDDAVIRGVWGVAAHAVAGNHLDAVETGLGEMGAGGINQPFVDVDRGYAALLADEVGDEGGVVAGAGANLEHVVARLEVELLEHDGDHGGLGGRAGGLAGFVDFGDDG